MQDAISLGTGNSRYLKSVGGFMALYPSYEDFAAALVAGTLPIDLNGIDPDGWAQQGTALDKAHLLTDATAALMDLGAEATPNEMLAALANKINASGTSVTQLTQKVNGLITYGTADLTAGSSNLPTGTIYVKYE